ncbi:methyltransferase [Toxoplasma gondii RUB]|uniref:Methyltransferase n=8 Tax=Toxoplasma gondii TaxID=5811 RepID=S7UYZ0_TOXGG|nr:methyltransferase [Toxoplasma gondii GT1]KAF4641162.1 methyltransferase [Toxoplasma gondii]KFG40326.1 methyltransferase [Toxoplasma gondii FOU]KFG49174.1 methyltransferase [Toxoplasma gondii GAB2-2007-GAL-DOM2]KFG65335.1 methyltransferase [Toxoplasma gondii RUB]KFH15273.1 methyltransferase [Toxoplasma gondii MAS]PUA89647.1 methyltransferase [Toxoplasma gondii TgCATBr9]RQX71312.1 methyltransferase [Toxoplasma gondii CAST]
MSRPEYEAPADVFYNALEAKKYARSSRMQAIQTQLTDRALELLLLPVAAEGSGETQPSLLLDLGFGSGISGARLAEKGHFVVGVDISKCMLDEAVDAGNTEENADAILGDLGSPLRFRPGVFDGAISISALQWLCSAIRTESHIASEAAASNAGNGEEDEDMDSCEAEDGRQNQSSSLKSQLGESEQASMGDDASASSDGAMSSDNDSDSPTSSRTLVAPSQIGDAKTNAPYKRLRCLFQWLFASLKTGGRAVLQFYPDSPQQVEMVTSAALRSGFGGGIVVDYPNSTKAKKYFLVLWVGGSHLPGQQQQLQQLQAAALGADGPSQIESTRRERQKQPRRGKSSKATVSRREWIEKKKERQRLQGKKVRHQSKYTGRKRKDKF